jgi:hypothetical protein
MSSILKHKDLTEISYLVNAENQITEVLAKMIDASSSEENKIALRKLSDEIRSQIEKIKEVKLHKILYH